MENIHTGISSCPLHHRGTAKKAHLFSQSQFQTKITIHGQSGAHDFSPIYRAEQLIRGPLGQTVGHLFSLPLIGQPTSFLINLHGYKSAPTNFLEFDLLLLGRRALTFRLETA